MLHCFENNKTKDNKKNLYSFCELINNIIKNDINFEDISNISYNENKNIISPDLNRYCLIYYICNSNFYKIIIPDSNINTFVELIDNHKQNDIIKTYLDRIYELKKLLSSLNQYLNIRNSQNNANIEELRIKLEQITILHHNYPLNDLLIFEVFDQIKTYNEEIEKDFIKKKEIIDQYAERAEKLEKQYETIIAEKTKDGLSAHFKKQANHWISWIYRLLLFIAIITITGFMLWTTLSLIPENLIEIPYLPQVKQLPHDVLIMRLSIVPIAALLLWFFIILFNRSKLIQDEYNHKKALALSMIAISDKLSESEKAFYYQSLFTALNRSPVDMLLAKKSGDNDSDLNKILPILLAQTINHQLIKVISNSLYFTKIFSYTK